MSENRNTIIAIVLSALVLIAWQYFYNIPQMEKDRAAHQAQSELQQVSDRGGAEFPHARSTRGGIRGGCPGCCHRVQAARQDQHPSPERKPIADWRTYR